MKCVAQVVLDSVGVTDGNHRKLAEDSLNGNDVQYKLLVVKLVYHTTDSNQHIKPTAIMSIIAITHAITIIVMILMIVITFLIVIIRIIIIIVMVRIIVAFKG
jgi:hypothetical protein